VNHWVRGHRLRCIDPIAPLVGGAVYLCWEVAHSELFGKLDIVYVKDEAGRMIHSSGFFTWRFEKV
jgi:hypothetical protein